MDNENLQNQQQTDVQQPQQQSDAAQQSQQAQQPTINNATDLHNFLNQYQQQQQDAKQQAPAQQQSQQQSDSGADSQDQTEPHVATQQDKDANAFAEMRVQNKAMADMLKKIADATGIQYTDQNDMLAKLNSDALTKLAEKQGVPVEILQRMETLERNSQLYLQQQTEARLRVGFANIKQEYNLSDDEMMAFAKQLDDDNVDLSKVDLKAEYQNRNFEAIVQKRIDAAVAAALSKDQQAQAQSTQPTAQGAAQQATTKPEQINSVAALRSWLASQR